MYDWEVKIKSPKDETGSNEYLSLYQDRISGAYAVSDDTGEGHPEKDEGGHAPFLVDLSRPLEIIFDFIDSDRIFYVVPVVDRNGEQFQALASLKEVNGIVKECGLEVKAPQALIDLISMANSNEPIGV